MSTVTLGLRETLVSFGLTVGLFQESREDRDTNTAERFRVQNSLVIISYPRKPSWESHIIAQSCRASKPRVHTCANLSLLLYTLTGIRLCSEVSPYPIQFCLLSPRPLPHHPITPSLSQSPIITSNFRHALPQLPTSISPCLPPTLLRIQPPEDLQLQHLRPLPHLLALLLTRRMPPYL